MITHDVPLHIQGPDSEDCGPVSAAMILDFFHVTDNQEEVIAKVPKSYFGTTSFDNAVVLIEYGLEVTVVTANPLVFDGDFLHSNPTPEAIRKKVVVAKDNERDKGKRATIESLLRYIDKGGGLVTEIPNANHITQALDHNKLVGASTYAKAIGQNEGGYHFVVIGGYGKEKFLVYNPWPQSRHKSWERINEVMFAIHAGTTFDYDNGTLLVVGKPD